MSQFFASGGQSIGVSASFITPSHEYSGLISFRMDWLALLAVQGTLKSLLQHRSSEALLRMGHPGTRYSSCLPGALGPKRKMDRQTDSLVWGDCSGKQGCCLSTQWSISHSILLAQGRFLREGDQLGSEYRVSWVRLWGDGQ